MSVMTESLDIIKRHLVFDETEAFTGGDGQRHAFRIRIWRGTMIGGEGTPIEVVPVVLVSQLAQPNAIPPHWMAKKLANYIFGALLHFTPLGMFYFEAELDGHDWTIQQNHFEVEGYSDRRRLIRPTVRNQPLASIENLVGSTIEL